VAELTFIGLTTRPANTYTRPALDALPRVLPSTHSPHQLNEIIQLNWQNNTIKLCHHRHTTTVLRPFFRDHPGEPVPENFWTLWCKRGLTEVDTQTIRLGATPSRLTSAHLHHPPFLQAGCPSCRPTNSVKALKATIKLCQYNSVKALKATIKLCQYNLKAQTNNF